MAELTHGIDDERKETIKSLVRLAVEDNELTNLINSLKVDNESSLALLGDIPYAACSCVILPSSHLI